MAAELKGVSRGLFTDTDETLAIADTRITIVIRPKPLAGLFMK
jgi:hypothetical protein